MGSKKVSIEFHKKCLEKATASCYHEEVADSAYFLGEAYFDLGEYEKAIEYYERGIKSCTEIKNFSGLTAILYRKMGRAYIELKKYIKAIECLNKSVPLSDELITVARSNENLALAHANLGQYDEAINCNQLALDACTAIGDQQGIVYNCTNLGPSYGFLGRNRQAIEYAKRGLEESIALDDHITIARNHSNLGSFYLNLKEHENAIHHYEQYLEMNSSKANHSEIAAVVNALGEAYLDSHKYKKAIEFYKKSLKMNTAMGKHPMVVRANEQLAKAYHRLGNDEKAIDFLKSALATNTEIGNKPGIAFDCEKLCLCYGNIGEDRKGNDYLELALHTNTESKNQLGIASNCTSLGLRYGHMGDIGKAIEFSKRGLEASTAMNDRNEMAVNHTNLSRNYCKLGDYEKAIYHCTKNLEIVTAIATRQAEIAYANVALGDIHLSTYKYEKAIQFFQKSIEIYTASGNIIAIPNVTCQLGNAYHQSGKFENAIDCFKETLQVSTTLGYKSFISFCNANLGMVYISTGVYKKAMDYFKKVSTDAFYPGEDYTNGLEIHGSNLGYAVMCLGEYEKAIDCLKKSLEVATEKGNRLGIALINCNLGYVYQKAGEYEKSIKYTEDSLEISTEFRDQSSMAKGNRNLGDLYLFLGQYEKAMDCYKKSLEIATEMESNPEIARCVSSLGNVYCGLGKFEIAIPYLKRALEVSTTVGDRSLMALGFDAHKVLMSCFVSLGRIESGLLVTDLGKAKELYLSIERRQNSLDTDMFGYAGTIFDRIKNKEEKEEIERLQTVLFVESNEIKTSILVFAFDFKKFLTIWILNGDIICMVPESDGRLETFVRLISKLSETFNVSINPDSSFFKLPFSGRHSSQTISRSERATNKSAPETLANSPCEDAVSNTTILKQLNKLLFEPVKDIVKGNKLMIVPDKHLFFVPFSSLIDENDCYLSQSYSIQITPSLHTLKFSMERSNDSATPGFALFVGNPTVGKVSLNDSGFKLQSLPNATVQVASLSKLFTARPLVEAEAKKYVVLDFLSGASIIHIAAHGEPKRGEIMLAPDLSLNEPSSSLPNPDSYLLTQNDITSISLQARLVVLCCCHTGQSKISSVGVIGIARSFLAAGARSVLATLWPISDEATKDFMEAFYDELLQETSVCEALRRVMSLFQKHEREDYRSFFIWAPFTLYGEDVTFKKSDIETIRKKSNKILPECGFALFVGNLITSDPLKANEDVICVSKLFEARPLLQGEEARKKVLLGLLNGASIIHISALIEHQKCEIVLSPCGFSNQGSPPQQLLTQKDIQGTFLQARLVVLHLRHSRHVEVSSEGIKSVAQAFLAAGARSVLVTLWCIDDNAGNEFIETFYKQLLLESSVSESLEKAKELFYKQDKEDYRSSAVKIPFQIFGEDVMFQKHDVETIRKKCREMSSGFVVSE